MEHRLDAYKFVVRNRRPVPRRVAGIGSWDGILKGVTYLSSVTNVSQNMSILLQMLIQ